MRGREQAPPSSVSIRRSTKGSGHKDGRTGFGAPHVKPLVRPSILPNPLPQPLSARCHTFRDGKGRKHRQFRPIRDKALQSAPLLKERFSPYLRELPCAGYEGAPTGGPPASICSKSVR